MRRAVVQCGLVLLAMWVSAYAQSAGGLRPSAGASDRPQCTDLSRQFVQPCPKRPPERAAPGAGQSFTFERSLLRDLFHTQKTFWTSPVRWRVSDLNWAVPFAGISAALIASDTEIERNLRTRPSLVRRSNDLTQYGTLAFGGAVAGTYLWGKLRGNDRLSETAWMAGEAVANSFATTFVLKAATQRARPEQATSTGFGQGGSSFPSEHAAAAWSIASVFAHEYPGPATKLLAYGAASALTASRVVGRKHFASDAFIGSTLGWWLGRQVWRQHRDPEADLGGWGTFTRGEGEATRDPSSMGSPYVPLDSWVYPAFDRLAALGYVQTAFAGMRPWTRMECARLVEEVSEQLGEVENSASAEVQKVYYGLKEEFAAEWARRNAGRRNLEAKVESIYTRAMGISGEPVTDGYHFAQTITNDYGRPYQEGLNNVTGFSARATAGRIAFYVRGEYQHSSFANAAPEQTRLAIAHMDSLPTPPATPLQEISRLRLLDSYVVLSIANWQLSFGKQSLWWGPGQGAPMMLSNNASPITMLRMNRVTPARMPLLSKFLGPVRSEFFFGQLAGHHFVGKADSTVEGSFAQPLKAQPFIHGQRFSFKPTRNFEFGFSRTTIMGGPGLPLTFSSFKHSLLGSGNALPGTSQDPGDRRSGLDWSYRLPLMRNWVTFYGDALADDQFSPIAYWDRSALRAGLYLSQLPKLPKIDLRIEGTFTDVPAGGILGRGFFYSNARFRNGYTTDGFLIGSWIGRDGQGAQAWLNYWFSPRNRIQLSFRHQKASQQFDPGGGSLTDVGVRGDYWSRWGLGITAMVQYERWLFPVIRSGPQKPFTASIEIQFQPQRLFGTAPLPKSSGQ